MVKFSMLVIGLRPFLKATLTLEGSKQVLMARLRNRESAFLDLMNRGVYKNPGSPYLKLIRLAGCEFGDLASAVSKNGIEATLKELMAGGVYLSWEEFKGKKDVVRGNTSFRLKEADLDNPLLPKYYQIQSSGSRSSGTKTTFDLSHRLAMSYYRLPLIKANNIGNFPVGLWYPILPALSGLVNALYQWKAGMPAQRWFSPVEERQVQSPFRHRLAMRFMIFGTRLWGGNIPRPEYTSLDNAIKVAQWIATVIKQSGGCILCCYVSLAVKVAQAAMENHLDIRGTHFVVGGEPLTDAKRQQIEASGALITSTYVISEIGLIGCSCSQSGATDEVHFLHDSIALIQNKRQVAQTDIFVNAFIFTALLASAPKILLNVENDDYGTIENKSCDCVLGRMGYNRHLQHIRSFSKLTGVGMTILGTNIVRILEEVFPSKFGGSAADYQLLEEEDSDGQTHISLIINPAVGPIDERSVTAVLLDELRRSPHPGKLTSGIWTQAKTIRVKRMLPKVQMGKVMTLHLTSKNLNQK
jgi:hypothetical protein